MCNAVKEDGAAHEGSGEVDWLCYQMASNNGMYKLVMKYANMLPEYDGINWKETTPGTVQEFIRKLRDLKRKSHKNVLSQRACIIVFLSQCGLFGS